MKQHQLPNGLEIWQVREHESFRLYQSIFERRTYLPHGIGVGPGSVVFDVGANIGIASLFFALEYNAQVYAFEPVPELYNALKANFDKYNVRGNAAQVAISDLDKPTKFTYYPSFSKFSGIYENPESRAVFFRYFFKDVFPEEEVERLIAPLLASEVVECSCWTLSHAIREAGVEKIDLLKIDAEKSELDVLNGIDPNDWNKIGQIVAEVHRIEGRIEAMRSLLTDHGFSVTVENEYGPINPEDVGMLRAWRDGWGYKERR